MVWYKFKIFNPVNLIQTYDRKFDRLLDIVSDIIINDGSPINKNVRRQLLMYHFEMQLNDLDDVVNELIVDTI